MNVSVLLWIWNRSGFLSTCWRAEFRLLYVQDLFVLIHLLKFQNYQVKFKMRFWVWINLKLNFSGYGPPRHRSGRDQQCWGRRRRLSEQQRPGKLFQTSFCNLIFLTSWLIICFEHLLIFNYLRPFCWSKIIETFSRDSEYSVVSTRCEPFFDTTKSAFALNETIVFVQFVHCYRAEF